MGYLIVQMLIYLLIAAGIGFVAGWFLRGATATEEAAPGAGANASAAKKTRRAA